MRFYSRRANPHCRPVIGLAVPQTFGPFPRGAVFQIEREFMSAATVFPFPLQHGFQEWDGPDAYGPMPDLSKPHQRWTVRRKAAVIEAVRGGWMAIEDACELYTISVDEFLAWERDLDRYGLHGLRTTRYQIYRDTDNRAPAKSGTVM